MGVAETRLNRVLLGEFFHWPAHSRGRNQNSIPKGTIAMSPEKPDSANKKHTTSALAATRDRRRSHATHSGVPKITKGNGTGGAFLWTAFGALTLGRCNRALLLQVRASKCDGCSAKRVSWAKQENLTGN